MTNENTKETTIIQKTYILEMVTVDLNDKLYRTDIAISSQRSSNTETLKDILEQVRKFPLIKTLISLDETWDQELKPGSYNSLGDLADDLIEAWVTYPTMNADLNQQQLNVSLVKVYKVINNEVELIYNL